MNPITEAVKEIEKFYIDYYKEHWEKLLSSQDNGYDRRNRQKR